VLGIREDLGGSGIYLKLPGWNGVRYEAVGPVRDSIVRWRGAGLRVERKRQCRVVSVGSDGAQDE